jgi:very-short-patch-repair endonuclease
VGARVGPVDASVGPVDASVGPVDARIGPVDAQIGPVDARVGRIAAGQFGLITLVQLQSLGLTYTEVRRRAQKGRLFPLHRGVFAVGRPDVSAKGLLRAALLATTDGSFLSHRTSLAAQGLRSIDTRHIELTVIAQHTPRRPGLVIHRSSAEPHRSEVRERFGLRYSSLARALVEVAASEPPDELIRLMTQGIRKNLLEIKALEETIARHTRRPGIAKLQLISRRYLDPSDRKSELERSFDAHCLTDPRIPPYEKNVHMGPYEIDCWFGSQRLAVELDGRPYHVALKDFDRDRAKDIWLQRQGNRVMRITDFMWEYARTQALDDLLALLALGGWLPEGAARAA